MRAVIVTGLMLALVLAVGALIYPRATPGPGLAVYEQRGRDYRVEILRDDFGVPHVYGRGNADAAFGLAYAHAEDDFTTIQEVILATRGSLAAVRGRGAAATDYLVHLMGVWPAVAARFERDVSPAARQIARAYADGINLYAARHPDQTEALLLPVTAQDIVAGFLFKSPLFYGFDKVLGELLAGAPRQLAQQGPAALQYTGRAQPEPGSQGVALAPARTGDGYTRLLVNSHQPLTGPVAWYEARLHSEEGLDIVGGTFPGSPLILHGHNRHLGWANTVNKPDLVDVYRLHLNPDNDQQYLLDGRWRDLAVEEVGIRVKLLGPLYWTFTEPLYRSVHGPVLKLAHGAYALRWAGMGELRGLDQLLAQNLARDRDEFEAALAMGGQPSLNYVYADARGNIAHYYNGRFPRREEGWDWSADLPGDRSDLIWAGYLPFTALPATRNPPSGVVFNANNTPWVATVGPGGPDPGNYSPTLGIEQQMTNRALRLRTLLAAPGPIDRARLRAIKYDLHYDSEFPPLQALREMLRGGPPADEPELAAAFDLLRQWDLATGRDNRAAALGVLTLGARVDYRTAVEGVSMLDSLRAAVGYLRRHFGRLDPAWGEVNRLRRGEREWPLDGGPDILRAVYGTPDPASGALVDEAGDSYILFVEWDEAGRPQSWSVHNFGSGTTDAGSPHYADQAPLFAAMREKPLYLERSELERHASRAYSPVGEVSGQDSVLSGPQ